jgi:hypothetical protein
MKIPGNITGPILTGAVLGTTLGLFTVLPISPTGRSTSEGNTSGNVESLEVETEKLRLKVTGKNTMAALTNLMLKENKWGTLLSNEKY